MADVRLGTPESMGWVVALLFGYHLVRHLRYRFSCFAFGNKAVGLADGMVDCVEALIGVALVQLGRARVDPQEALG